MSDKIETVEQKIVFFYDDELIAIRADDRQIYVSFRHLCDALGVARYPQVRKIREHDVLSEGYREGTVIIPSTGNEKRGGGEQQAGLFRIDLIPMWLTTINANRVKDAVRIKIVQYQKEAAKVLWDAFNNGQLSLEPNFRELLRNTDSPAVQAYRTAQAVMQMAQQQIILEARVDNHEKRLQTLEADRFNQNQISNSQASSISQAVKMIALELGKRSGRNEFGGVYGELHRRFQIAGYRELPKVHYEEAMNFFRDWYASLVDDDHNIPF